MNNQNILAASVWFARIALAAAFLSAVADRFGLWGPPGATGVAWGDLKNFNDYVAVRPSLNRPPTRPQFVILR